MSNRWYVHIQGSDDLTPAEGEGLVGATIHAHKINEATLEYLAARAGEGRPVTEYTPLVWAIPIMPGDKATAHITDDED